MKSLFSLFLLFTVSLSFAQVGIGTTNPQAQLEVANGNVRFSSYGNGTFRSATPTFLLGVDANGDIIETNLTDHSGLQYYTWNIANTSQPNIGSVRNLGLPSTSGRWLAALDNTTLNTLRPDNEGYIIRFVGTIKVQNTGDFTFTSRSDDGSRIYIDDVLVLENWFNQVPTTRSGTINLAAGEHKIEFWYYENTGGETMEFTWGANPDGYTVGSFMSASQFFVK